jgi:hypothetical protein
MTCTTRPRPALGVELIPIKGEGILFDQQGQRLFHLNPMAACIWSQLDGERDLDGVAEAVAETVSIAPAQARQFALDMLKAWRRIGLLRERGAAQPLKRAGDLAEEHATPATEEDLRIPVNPARRRYEMLGTVFSLGFSSPALEALAAPALAHLRTDANPPGCRRIDLVETPAEIRAIHDGYVIGRCDSASGLAPLLHGLLGLLSIRTYRYLLALHASGLERSGQALILAGRSGSGKTTMAAALTAGGWGYMSDDTILLLPDTLEAVAVPYSLTVKSGAWPVLRSRFPALDQLPIHLRADHQRVRYLSPPRRDFASPLPVRWIGFLHRPTGNASSIRRLDRIEGIYRMLEHCCAVPRLLSAMDVRHLAEWSADIHFFEFAIVDLDDAVSQINALAEEGDVQEAGYRHSRALPISSDSRGLQGGPIL